MSDRDTPHDEATELEAWQLDMQLRAAEGEGRLELAAPLAERLFEIRDQKLGAFHPDTLAAATTALTHYTKLTQWAAALGLLERLIDARMLHGAEEPAALEKHLQGLSDLARLLVDAGELDKARRAATKALEIKRKTFGEGHLELASSFALLADIELERGELDSAADAALAVFEIRSKHLATHAADLYADAVRIGDIFAAMKDYEEARKSYRLAVDITARALDSDPRKMGEALLRYGRAALAEEKPEFAERPLESALEMLEKASGPKDLSLIVVLDELGKAYLALDDYDAAEETFERMRDVYAAHYPPESTHCVVPRVHLAEVATKRGEHARAAALYEEALSIAEKEFGKESLRLRVVLDRAAEARLEEGNLPRAKELSTWLLRLFEPHVAGPDDPALLPAVRKLADIALREKLAGADDVHVEEVARLLDWATRLMHAAAAQITAETEALKAKRAQAQEEESGERSGE
ncbi:tetratricopeptide repeat protein [Polyangium jinanense]|uniref:Tetratricopeptide repeat protein n=1 Tax=Polyangium jinanense TaxID=2829994 RepID=A0A9X3X2T2_9BACT|nr:tetratricopeptide repeat protein [Polyangium jinanense]MDC3955813.1 tetratricopeptide repeat protein [Polyangium jinanense]MDC3983172.1 tetratricopeptide repeat protein [Polyangium jinanense]